MNNKVCYEENGKIYADFLPKPIIVDKTFEDESYLGHYENKKVYLKKTDKGDYYVALFGKEINPLCFVSNKLDTVICLVSRNANTSIVLSGLYAEGFTQLINYPNSKFLWHDKELMTLCHQRGYLKPLKTICHKNFTNHYIVIDEPYKRYIRALNKILVEPSLLKVDEHLKKNGKEKEFIDEMLYYSDLCENDENFLWERHLGLQSTYLTACQSVYNSWDVIKLAELPQQWEQIFKSKWLKNNISNSSQRKLTLNSLNEEQKNKLDSYLLKDIHLWCSIK